MISKLSLFFCVLFLFSGCAAIDGKPDRGIGESSNQKIQKVYETDYGECVYLVRELSGLKKVQPGLELPIITKYYIVDGCEKPSRAT